MEFDFLLLIFATVAGILTVFAPCVFTLLPVILAGSTGGEEKYRPYIISISTGVSIFIFTLLLKATTTFIDIDESTWNIISGVIILLFGIFTLFPTLWDRISVKIGLNTTANSNLQSASNKKGIWGAILVGFSLGPVFTSCSPTYALIVSSVLPVTIGLGAVYLAAYSLGLILVLIIISYFGQKVITGLKWASDPHGKFKKFLGILFIIVGIGIIFGLHKELQIFIVDNLPFLDVTNLEDGFVDRIDI